ncbi:uncharacterized protein HKW66_Vig0060150 [Vigna angularis]|uniref:Uncharacterized protein n=3 Tax=Phaseolus angularis TaxID=3914 RepID=A0A8T0L794_PHAAN|nr:uncharacterized protein LOC108328616 [Vigna angularis]KAG2406758.1 uncharacterized protein HKW66_Vig0060150 [Vigna angularis]BAT86495.1 hypothetical protein VIGAN_04415200 [Vigna angularis var. angularis]
MLSESGNNRSSKMSFRITKDDRFLSRLMAKEATTPNSSSRIFYYGETSVAVPFTWEAQPGTPKHPLSDISLPPLTPPPSYFSNLHSVKGRSSKPNNMFSTILPRLLGQRKSHHESPPTSSRSPSSSSSSSSSPSFSHPLKHKCSNGFRWCYPFGNTIGNVNVSHGAD